MALTPKLKQLAGVSRGWVYRFRNRLKRAQFFPVGFRADPSAAIAWTVSADGGGEGGQIIIGKNTVLDTGVILRANGSKIVIGDNSSINPYCIIHGGGGVTIGDGVRIGSHTVIVAANHIFQERTKFIYLQGETIKGITISDDVWIGAGAKILDGVVVGRGTVVAAGAVLTNSTEPYSVVAGVPAKRLKQRGK